MVVTSVVVLGGAALAFAPRSSPAPAPVQAGKLRVSVPHGFYDYPIFGGHLAGARPPVVGHLLTDFRLPAHTTVSKLITRWAAIGGSGPPPNRVALMLGPGTTLAPDRLHLPLSLKQPWYREHFANGKVGGYRYGFIRFRQADYSVTFWSGSAAPASDRAAVLRALESIRPAR